MATNRCNCFTPLRTTKPARGRAPRRILTKVEITRTGGLNIRHVVTNMSGHAGGIYRGFYTPRGNVPERPIGELKNGLQMDRLSSPRFLANDYKLLVHVLAYLLYALFREANAATPELATLEVGTARTRLFKAGAVVKATHRRIWFQCASHWPGARLLQRAAAAVKTYVAELQQIWREQGLFVLRKWHDRRYATQIHFAPVPSGSRLALRCCFATRFTSFAPPVRAHGLRDDQ